jgi:hypothetical protein
MLRFGRSASKEIPAGEIPFEHRAPRGGGIRKRLHLRDGQLPSPCGCLSPLFDSRFAIPVMKNCLLAVATIGLLFSQVQSLDAASPEPAIVTNDFGIFKVAANVQVSMVIISTDGPDVIVKKALASSDFINLALGRPLGTKINPKTEVLAAAVTFETHGAPPLSKLIVCDPSQDGVNQVKTTIATLSELDFQNAYENRRNVGFGYGKGNIVATTLGDPAKNGFVASTFQVSGGGGGVHLDPRQNNENARPIGSGNLQGPLKFIVTDKKNETTTFNGIVTRGTFTLSGKTIGTYTE